MNSRKLMHGGLDHTEDYEYTMPVVSIFVILVLGLAGSLIPPLINVYAPKFNLNERWGFRFFNGLAAGLVLAVGWIHSVPDAIGSFEDAFGEYEDTSATYAWGGFCALMGALITFFAEEFVHRNVGRFGVIHGGHDHDHHHGHGKEAGTELENSTTNLEEGGAKDLELQKQAEQEVNYYTELYVLLFGLSFHSIFVGIALGVTNDWGLFAAIIFHQFFEGLALGARVARAGFRSKAHIWFLDIIYALSAPIGVAIGIGIESALHDDPKSYSIVNGIFQGLSAGILIYVALIHMMKEEMERPEFKKAGSLLYIMYIGFLVGAGAMSIIGIWA